MQILGQVFVARGTYRRQERASDAELLEASRRGDHAAFGVLIARFARLVTAVSYAATRDHVLTEDIAQETFLAAWRDLGRLRDASALRPWLCGIARNLAHKARRRRDREEAADLDAFPAGPTPFDATHERDLARIATAALGRVPELYREALVLFYFEERSVDDVARTLGVTEQVVHKRLSRGRRYLAEGVEHAIAGELERHGKRRDLVACVLALLPIAPSRADAAPKGSSMWKPASLAVAAVTIAVGTFAVSSHPTASGEPATRSVPAASTATSSASATHAGSRPQRPPALPVLTCEDVAHQLVANAAAAAKLDEQCRDEGWSQAELACMVATTDLLSAQACRVPRPLAPPALAPTDTDATCRAVVEHMLALSPPPADDPRPEAQYATLLSQVTERCTEEAWSEARRRCMLAAGSVRNMVPCLQLDAQRPELPASAEASCAAVGRHIGPQIAGELRGVAAILGREIADVDVVDHIAAVCTQERWPESHRRCLAAATTTTQITACRSR